MKASLKNWNTTVFGNLHKNLELARTKLQQIQFDIATNGPTYISLEAEVTTKTKVLEATRRQEAFWCDRARVKWLKEGDKCSSFFHVFARSKSTRSQIHSLKDGDNLLTD